MGFITRRLTTVFKGTSVLGFKLRRNAKKINRTLRRDDSQIFIKIPEGVELDHAITREMKAIERVLSNSRTGIVALDKFLFEAQLQEDNFHKAIEHFLQNFERSTIPSEYARAVITSLERVKKLLKGEDRADRDEYRDLESSIIAAEKGRETLRIAIKTRFKDVSHESIIERIAVRMETKSITKCIDRINNLAEEISQSKSQRISTIVGEIAESIEGSYKELHEIKKRAFLWMSKMLFDLFVLEEMLGKYARGHLMPMIVVAKDNKAIGELIGSINTHMEKLAQAFRIEIKRLEGNIKRLERLEQGLARRAT